MKLIRYKEMQGETYIWFWVNDEQKAISPDFTDRVDAMKWYGQQIREWQASDS